MENLRTETTSPPDGTQTSLDLVGARWWSLDIHAHSPASFDYAGVEGKASNKPLPKFEEWVQAYIDAGVDGIVVTDHNSYEGIDSAREALLSLRETNPNLPNLVIFPGVELTLSGGYHALAIFDHSSDAVIVRDILTRCNYKGKFGRSDNTADITVSQAAEIVDLEGGLFIPAHIDQPAGILSMDSRDLDKVSSSTHIIAAEVADEENIEEAHKRGWVAVLGSDAHHLSTEGAPEPEKSKAPGTHLTMVKAEELTLEGLRLALAEPSESIRRSKRGYPDLNDVKHDHIKSIHVLHKGIERTYEFGPWMNCLIGGRGVGKSTVIELLRLALGRMEELPETLKHDLLRFSPSAVEDERWWDEETEIEVTFTRASQLLQIKWSGASPSEPAIKLWEKSAWVPQSGRVIDRAPVRIFSQKQIYELATRPQSFLYMLDDMQEIRKSEWEDEFKNITLEFKAERNRLRQLLSESEKADRLRGQLQEVKARLRHLETLRASAEYQELSGLESKIQSLVSTELSLTGIESNVIQQASAIRNLPLDMDSSVEYSAFVGALEESAELLDQAQQILSGARKTWVETGIQKQWEERVEVLGTWINEQGGSSPTSADQTSRDRQLEAGLELQLREFENSETRLGEQRQRIAQVLEKIEPKRRELFERRRSCTNGINGTQGARTKLEVFFQGSISNLGDDLRDLLRISGSYDSVFSPDGIPSLVSHRVPQHPDFALDIVKFKEKLIDLVENGTDSEIARSLRINARFFPTLEKSDSFDLITDILLWFPADLIRVMYKTSSAANFIPVDRGSPGQRTAALLAVVLQMGKEPLLLDQPEDDLENKLIRYLAVETLKSIKQDRQLIISTHNANVVVTSGAENILVLEHDEAVPKVEATGTLQQPTVKDNVREILEGGEDAIRTRYMRLVGVPSQISRRQI